MLRTTQGIAAIGRHVESKLGMLSTVILKEQRFLSSLKIRVRVFTTDTLQQRMCASCLQAYAPLSFSEKLQSLFGELGEAAALMLRGPHKTPHRYGY